MANKDQILRDAFDYVMKWKTKKGKFADLLTADVVWVEHDTHLAPGSYVGKQDVLLHIEQVLQRLQSATLTSVTVQQPKSTTTDDMQVKAHPEHECITDVTFRGDLIARVHHCLRH
ncbi:MAG: hypothetical protein ACRD0C_02340 [Acidimicrobiia bacterium]